MEGAQARHAAAHRRSFAITASGLGSYCALILAMATLILGVSYLLLPARIGDVLGVLFQAHSHPVPYQVFYGDWALTGLLGVGVVGPATRLLVTSANGWTDWTSKLAYLGFSVTVIQSVHGFVNVPNISDLYHGCGTCTASLSDQQTIAKWLYVSLPLDPMNWLTFGAVALWIFAVSLTALGSAGTPRGLAYLGIAAAIGYAATVIGGSLDLPLDVLLLLAAVVAAAWYAWVGWQLRREA